MTLANTTSQSTRRVKVLKRNTALAITGEASAEEALTLLKATQIDLEALYRSEDPFKGPATVAVADEDQIASSQPNDFKDFGEE